MNDEGVLIIMLEKYLSRTIEAANGCRVWQGSLNSDGYARGLIDGNYNGIIHREIFFLVNGYYPEVVRHTCDNRRCINPDHLIEGTQLDNVNDRHERGRTYNQVSNEEINAVEELYAEGRYYREIADILRMKFKRVEYIMNKFIKEN
jgi:hypothetical protein